MITLTESAGHKVNEMLKEEEDSNQYLRVRVEGGGCSGLSYGMVFDKHKQDTDTELQQHGIPIVIDEESAKIIEGTVIDYKQSLMGGGFTINNPNAIATCGCGTSFRTKEHTGVPGDC